MELLGYLRATIEPSGEHNRTRRHTRYVSLDHSMNCFIPNGLFEIEEACQYVRNCKSCNDVVQLFNYLEFLVCTLRVPPTLTGNVLTIIALILFLIAFFAMLFIVCYYFIFPNLVAVANQLELSQFTFGLIISTIMSMPDVLYVLNSCSRLRENSSLLLSESMGKTVGCFCIGMFMITLKSTMQVDPVFFISNMVMLMFGCIYVMAIMYYKVQLERDTEVYHVFNLFMHALLLIAIYIVYMLYVPLITNLRQRRNTDGSTRSSMSSGSYTITSTKILPIIWTTTTSNRTLSSLPNTVEPKNLPTTCTGWWACVYALNPFANMKNHNSLFILFCCPLWIVAALIIPVIDTKRPMHGWCKVIFCINFLLFPFLTQILGINEKLFYTTLFFGIAFTIVTIMMTEASKMPDNFIIFTLSGVGIGFSVFYIVDSEIDAALMQLLSYINDWKMDSVALVIYVFAYTFSEAVFCWSLVEAGYTEAALAITFNLTMFTVYSTMPQMVFQACTSSNDIAVVTAHTTTAFVFAIIIQLWTIFGVATSNFELRTSYGCFMLIMFGLFLAYIVMAVNSFIHPFGAQHTSIILHEAIVAGWA